MTNAFTAGPAHPTNAAAPRGAGAAEIVVVDDDRQVRETLVAMTRRLGYSSLGIDPEFDILAAIAAIGPSVVVLDLSLGRRDAVEVLHGLGDARYRGRVLLVSGRDVATLERVNGIGERCGLVMLAPLGKPVRIKELAVALSAVPQAAGSAPEAPHFDLAEAIRQRWLEVWYQPKIMLGSQRVHGAEALLRLRHPAMGLVLPGSFIPGAAEAAYEAMTGFVIESVARDWSVLRNHGWPLTLSINASITMIQRPAFLDMVRNAWPDPGKRPRLIVEVTEDELITDIVAALETATQLKLYDVDISIDDFGSGYSSFTSLRQLPFSELKLDKSFVIGCAADDKKRAFCEAAAALARQFEIPSVAEGIETAEDLAAVTKAGFDVGQGYFFARPRPLVEFIGFLGQETGWLAGRAQSTVA